MTVPHIAPRTLEVAKVKATGLTNKEVAYLLGVSEQTIKNHLSNLNEILGTTTFDGALNALGWVFPGGLSPELIAKVLDHAGYTATITAHEALDAVIAQGLEMARQARAVKALLKPDPRAVPRG